eukprot:901347-Rhodomonas_salina.3
MQDVVHLASLHADPDDPHDPSGQSAEDLQDDWEEESAVRELECERGAKSDLEAAEEERQSGARSVSGTPREARPPPPRSHTLNYEM